MLSVKADVKTEAVCFYVSVASTLVSRGLFNSVIAGVQIFQQKLGDRLCIEPCSTEAALCVNQLMVKAALVSPELHLAILNWRTCLVVV